ncbi:MAG TPA: TIGR01777 family oxidoreductase [Acidimicrobiales bacterium]|nr:TIGR01777 family oxidoreductase [Acidimicrobiales bacterium]
MNVLMSGGHGLIGGALTRRLRDDGHRVVHLVRPTGPPASPAADAVAWDPPNGRVDHGALERSGPIDAAVNLAGAGIGDRRWTPARRRLITASRRDPTRLLAEVLANLAPKPSVLVSGSAIGIYGDRGDEPLTEESGAGSGFLADVCQAWESASGPASDAGIRVVRLRTGVVLAPVGGILARLLPPFRLGLGARLGTGRQYVSWVTLEDHVEVVVRALGDARLSGPLNATAPRPVTNAELTRALGRALGRPARLALPRPVLVAALGRDLADELLLASQRALPARLETLGHRFVHPDIDSALTSVLAASGSRHRRGGH